MSQQFFGLDDQMFSDMKVDFHSFKNGEHRFRLFPPFQPGKLYHKAGLHWGFTTVDGKKKAVVCGLEQHGKCPICDQVDKNKGYIENLEASIVSELDPMKIKQVTDMVNKLKVYNENCRRKPMYLWNIRTEEGAAKVLQLTWNGHDPLFNKVKFYFKEKKIDITNPLKSYLVYCQRSGMAAKTRFQYEVLDNTEKQIDVPTLKDLSKIYIVKSLNYLAEIVKTGFVPADSEDITETNFDVKPVENSPVNQADMNPAIGGPVNNPPSILNNAQMPAMGNTQTQQQYPGMVNPVIGPTANVTAPAAQQPAKQEEKLVFTSEQDKQIQEMMAALNN
jgi:hypothetical protein